MEKQSRAFEHPAPTCHVVEICNCEDKTCIDRSSSEPRSALDRVAFGRCWAVLRLVMTGVPASIRWPVLHLTASSHHLQPGANASSAALSRVRSRAP